ncbi:MAG TPA: alpha/beta fold hydrolase [Longimicrobiales bacterium]|nr:alpha/beta fold hydrolase [Longimicrobiales bacterium]
MRERLGALLLAPFVALAWSPAARAQGLPPSRVEDTTLELADGSALRYGVAVPGGYDPSAATPRPLVLALHPGGRSEYYGSSFMRSIVEPALRSWGAVIVAPDVPDRSWSTERSERAVLELMRDVAGRYPIDTARVLVTGYSMGGRGAWYLAARHPEVFRGAVIMAGSPRDTDLDRMPDLPLHLLHSPNDEVVPFAPVEEAYLRLAARGHIVELTVLPGISHYSMGAYVPALRAAGDWMLARWAAARP